jgi:hypothetical protein
MERHGRTTAVGMAKLLVSTSLAHLLKAELLEDRHNFFWFEYRNRPHRLCHRYGLCPDEFSFELGIPVLKKHSDYLLQVVFEFIQCCRLGVCSRKAWWPRYSEKLVVIGHA